jgi:hypothetical protein
MENSTANGRILSTLVPRKLSELAFVTITNPNHIKDSRIQTTVRRHARASTNRSKQNRRKNLKLVFELQAAESQLHTKGKTAIVKPTNDTQSDKTTYEVSIDDHIAEHTSLLFSSLSPLNLLRPIGAGRGLDPLQPFPIAVDARMRDLVNFGLNSISSFFNYLANLFQYTRAVKRPIDQ